MTGAVVIDRDRHYMRTGLRHQWRAVKIVTTTEW